VPALVGVDAGRVPAVPGAGLGIIDLNDKNFDPTSGLTRAEGALAIYKMLN
jgi:hypothetical protein